MKKTATGRARILFEDGSVIDIDKPLLVISIDPDDDTAAQLNLQAKVTGMWPTGAEVPLPFQNKNLPVAELSGGEK